MHSLTRGLPVWPWSLDSSGLLASTMPTESFGVAENLAICPAGIRLIYLQNQKPQFAQPCSQGVPGSTLQMIWDPSSPSNPGSCLHLNFVEHGCDDPQMSIRPSAVVLLPFLHGSSNILKRPTQLAAASCQKRRARMVHKSSGFA